MTSGFYDIAQLTFVWLQAANVATSIGPDPRATPWLRPEIDVTDGREMDLRAARRLVPEIDTTRRL